MNAPVSPPKVRRPHLFTVADVRAMVEAGVIQEGAPIELIEGELVEMAGEGWLHTDWVSELGRWLHDGLDRSYVIVPGSTVVLSDNNAPKPDYYVFPASLRTEDVRGPDILLAIEVAHTTAAYDLGEKADLYARHGVRDYWVVHVENRQLFLHRDPAVEGFGSKQRLNADEIGEALLIPGLKLCLKDLPRVG